MDSLALYWMGLNADQATAVQDCSSSVDETTEGHSLDRPSHQPEPLFNGFVIPVLCASN